MRHAVDEETETVVESPAVDKQTPTGAAEIASGGPAHRAGGRDTR
jgi:hypothetical protein